MSQPNEAAAADTEVELPDEFRYTLAWWHNAEIVRRRSAFGRVEEVSHWHKHLSHGGSFEQFEYGSFAEKPVGYTRRCRQESHDTYGHQIALICTRKSRLLVVDVDDPTLFATSQVAQHVGLNDAMTRRGEGYHVHVYVPPDLPVEWPKQGPIPGGDIKSNGFVPAPQCWHSSGEMYRVVAGASLVTASVGLINAIERDRSVKDIATGTGVSGVGEGNEPTLFSYTGKLVTMGKTKDEAWPLWLARARELPLSDPSWPWSEVDYPVFERHWEFCEKSQAVNHPPLSLGELQFVASQSQSQSQSQSTAAASPREAEVPTEAASAAEPDEDQPTTVSPSLVINEGPPPVPPVTGARPLFFDELVSFTQDQAGMADLSVVRFGEDLGWDHDAQRFMIYSRALGAWRADGKGSEETWRRVRALSLEVHEVVEQHLLESGAVVRALDDDAGERRRANLEIRDARAWYEIFQNAGLSGVIKALGPTCRQYVTADFNKRARLLTFANGTYDVTTGALREHRREDLLTQRVPLDYRPELALRPLREVAPHFHALLWRMCGAPGELDETRHADRYRAVTRWCGYQLHGSNPEKKMAIFEGATDIGKNQVIEIIGEILGTELAWLGARPNLIIKQRNDRHDGEEFELNGKRLAVINELTETQYLDESQVLRLVNPEGAEVSLRQMRKDRVNVVVSWKLNSTTNELPKARLTPQVVNRLLIFPLSKVPVPKGEQYDIKAAVLESEREAVLAHLVGWWREWWAAREEEGSVTGLVITDEIVRKLREYQDENRDLYEQFFDEELELVEDAVGTPPRSHSRVWAAYQAYHRAQHPDQDIKFVPGRNKFYERLEALPGVQFVRDEGPDGKSKPRGLLGARLRSKVQANLAELSEVVTELE